MCCPRERGAGGGPPGPGPAVVAMVCAGSAQWVPWAQGSAVEAGFGPAGALHEPRAAGWRRRHADRWRRHAGAAPAVWPATTCRTAAWCYKKGGGTTQWAQKIHLEKSGNGSGYARRTRAAGGWAPPAIGRQPCWRAGSGCSTAAAPCGPLLRRSRGGLILCVVAGALPGRERRCWRAPNRSRGARAPGSRAAQERGRGPARVGWASRHAGLWAELPTATTSAQVEERKHTYTCSAGTHPAPLPPPHLGWATARQHQQAPTAPFTNLQRPDRGGGARLSPPPLQPSSGQSRWKAASAAHLQRLDEGGGAQRDLVLGVQLPDGLKRLAHDCGRRQGAGAAARHGGGDRGGRQGRIACAGPSSRGFFTLLLPSAPHPPPPHPPPLARAAQATPRAAPRALTPVQLGVHLLLAPLEVLQVLHPLEEGHCHAAAVGVDVCSGSGAGGGGRVGKAGKQAFFADRSQSQRLKRARRAAAAPERGPLPRRARRAPGSTVMPRWRRIWSASGVVGPLAASTTICWRVGWGEVGKAGVQGEVMWGVVVRGELVWGEARQRNVSGAPGGTGRGAGRRRRAASRRQRQPGAGRSTHPAARPPCTAGRWRWSRR